MQWTWQIYVTDTHAHAHKQILQTQTLLNIALCSVKQLYRMCYHGMVCGLPSGFTQIDIENMGYIHRNKNGSWRSSLAHYATHCPSAMGERVGKQHVN